MIPPRKQDNHLDFTAIPGLNEAFAALMIEAGLMGSELKG
jgi:hypothetical protein